jgi:hypothetical protein
MAQQQEVQYSDRTLAPKNKSEFFNRLGNGKYGYTFETHRYPADIDTDTGYNHFIVFFINKQISGKFTRTEQQLDKQVMKQIETEDRIAAAQAKRDQQGDVVFEKTKEELDKLQNDLRSVYERFFTGGQISAVERQEYIWSRGGFTDATQQHRIAKPNSFIFSDTRIKRPTIRATDAIVLGMPDQIPSVTYNMDYINVQGSALTQEGVKSFSDQNVDLGGLGKGLLVNIAKNVLNRVDVGDDIQAAAQANLIGGVANPHIEFLFQSIQPRMFQYDFKFRPRSQEEMEYVHNIIFQFKKNMHPETGFDNHVLFYPNEFNIQYFFKGVENDYLYKLDNLVLTQMTTNYSPETFSTFRGTQGKQDVGGGKRLGASPTEIDLSMTFQETNLITRDKIKQIGY